MTTPQKNTRQAENPMAAPAPVGVDASMALTTHSDLLMAFDMLDERREGALNREQARLWLRCAGWALTDEALDDMLNSVPTVTGTGPIKDKTELYSSIRGQRTKWAFRQLHDISIAENSKQRENSSLAEMQEALRKLAGNKPRISKERFVEFATTEKMLNKDDLDEFIDILGLTGVKVFDCDDLAKKMVTKICAPPAAFERKTF